MIMSSCFTGMGHKSEWVDLSGSDVRNLQNIQGLDVLVYRINQQKYHIDIQNIQNIQGLNVLVYTEYREHTRGGEFL